MYIVYARTFGRQKYNLHFHCMKTNCAFTTGVTPSQIILLYLVH